MPVLDGLSRWIIRRATTNPPAGREDWARAMQAEFEAADTDRLGWALGCWRTMVGWRLRADWLFLLAIIAGPVILELTVYPSLSFISAITLPDDVFKPLFLPLSLLQLAVTAALLAAWRPRQYRQAALGVAVMPAATSTVLVMQMVRDWRVFTPDAEIMGAQPLIGCLALLAACWIGAAAGAWLGRTARQARRAT